MASHTHASPIQSPRRWSQLGALAGPPVITDLMQRALAEPDLLSLAAGFTDNTALPSRFVVEAIQALTALDNENEHLQYGSNRGRQGLCSMTAQRVSELDGSPGTIDPESVFITNGSQQALYLALLSLCQPGDAILVEKPTYFVFLEMLASFGVEAIALPGNLDGRIAIEELPDFFRQLPRERVKAVYLNSYFANPTSSSLTHEEKSALASCMAAIDYYPPILEDCAYRELYFDQPAEAVSILAMDAFAPFPKLCTGTYTKSFSTGLKIGFGICPDPDWKARLLGLKGCQDFGTANFNQAIIEHVLRTGTLDTHLQQLHCHYRRKAQIMAEALANSSLQELGWTWSIPQGGLYFWVRAPEGLDTSIHAAFCEACLLQKVLYVPGDLCMADATPKSFARLSFGAIPENQMALAIERFSNVAEAFQPIQ